MVNFKNPTSNIHVLARGILLNSKGIVLCRVKESSWYFLPGGHVENGEVAKASLLRELREELGDQNYQITDFVGVVENVFSLTPDSSQHELNLVFKVKVPEGFNLQSLESDLEFKQVKIEELSEHNILPTELKSSLINWFGTGTFISKI